MAYKKYFNRNGKKVGPYYYESYRDETGKVKKRYVGTVNPDKKSQQKRVIPTGLVLLFFVFGILILFFAINYVTGGLIFNLFSHDNLVIKMNQGELVPPETKLIIEQNGVMKEFSISELMNCSLSGNYFISGKNLNGSGFGCGFEGFKIIYPEVHFTLILSKERDGGADSGDSGVIESNTPAESNNSEEYIIGEENNTTPEASEENEDILPGLAGAGIAKEEISAEVESSAQEDENAEITEGEIGEAGLITGNAIGEEVIEIELSVKRGDSSDYRLEGRDVRIKEGSVYSDFEELDSDILTLETENDVVHITTNYAYLQEGFGEEYLGKEESIKIPLSELEVSGSDDMKAILVYNGDELASFDYDSDKNPITNESSLIEENVTELKIIKEIKEIEIRKDGSYIIDLDEYFSGAEFYFAEKAENISLSFHLSNLTIIPDERFAGKRDVSVTAYSGEINLTQNFSILVSETSAMSIETKKYNVVLGQPVKWHKKVRVNSLENVSVELPKEAQNISVKQGVEVAEAEEDAGISDNSKKSLITGDTIRSSQSEGERWINQIFSKITGLVTGGMEEVLGEEIIETEDEKILVLDEEKLEEAQQEIDENNETEILVEYYTDAPVAVETNTSSGKLVVISAPDELGYTDILSFAEVPERVRVEDAEKIKIYWQENKSLVDFDAYDLDENGLVDYVEWITPHLSSQSFAIILITRAEHLDSNRNFIEDVFEEVGEKDYVFKEIAADDYLRVTFEIPLTSSRDISIYAKTNSSNSSEFECYDNKTEILTENGWKYFSDLGDYEKVMILNPETGEREFKLPTERQVYNNNGFMYNIKTEEGDLVVSEKHKVYSDSDNSNSDSSLVLKTGTFSCFFNNFSSDHKEQLYFNASARYSASLVCSGINLQALGMNSSNSSLDINLILLSNIESNLLNSSSVLCVFDSISSLLLENSSRINSGAISCTLLDTNISSESSVPLINKENSSFASATTIIYLHSLGNLYLLAKDSLTFLPNLNASSFVNSLLDVNSLKNSKSAIFCTNASLATSDQFIILNCSILRLSSSGTDKVKFGIFTSNMFNHMNTQDTQVYKSFGLQKIEDIYLDFNSGKEIYFLNSKNNIIKIEDIEKIPYSGKIYDVDVENDIILVRREGLEVWSGNSNSASVEVYEKDSSEKIAEFSDIREYKKYKILLGNLSGSQDIFDLLVKGSSVWFDYVVDPDCVEPVLSDCRYDNQVECEGVGCSWYDYGDFKGCTGAGCDSQMEEATCTSYCSWTWDVYSGEVSGCTSCFWDGYMCMSWETCEYSANVAPTSTLSTPANNYLQAAAAINLTINSSDADGNLKNITIFVWNSTGSVNYTNSVAVTGTSNSTIWEVSLVEDIYSWNGYVCDDADECAWDSSNRTFAIDASVISLDVTTPTIENTNVSQNGTIDVKVNVGCTGSTCGDVNVSLYGTRDNPSVIWTDNFENTTLWSETIGNANCAYKGKFSDCSSAGKFYLSTNEYAGAYSLIFTDWANPINYSKGLWEDIDLSSDCSGYPCSDFNVSFYNVASIGSGDFCKLWVMYPNGTNVDLWTCNDGDACDKVTGAPLPANYTYYNILLSSLGVDFSQNFELHLGAQMANSFKYCYFDNLNITGIDTQGRVYDSFKTPFYTSDSNPQTINLDEDETNEVTFTVNASGDMGTNEKFWVTAIKNSNSLVNDESSTFNLTIAEGGEPPAGDTTAPTFTTIPANTTVNYTQGFGVDFDATDETSFGTFYLGNWTNLFTINSSGYLRNSSVNIPVGTYIINVSINDSSGNTNMTWYQVVVGAEPDSTSPTFTTIPADAEIVYEIDWDGVLFVAEDETEFGSYAINDTDNFIINSTGFLNWTSQLAVGNYYVNVSINDTTGNENSTIYNLNITKAVAQGSLSGTTPITYGTAGDVEGTESNIGDGDVVYTLYRDGVEVSNPDTTTLGAGTYNYIYNSTEGANWTANASIGTFELVVNQGSSNCDVLFNETSPLTYPNVFRVYSNCDSDFTLSRNGTSISNNSVQSLGAETYNFSVQRTDTSNYTNIYDEELFSINKAVPQGSLTSSGTWTIEAGTEVTIGLSESNSGDGDVTYIVYRDGVSKNTGETWTPTAGTYNYVLNTTGGTNWTANSSMNIQTLTVQDTTFPLVTINSPLNQSYAYSTTSVVTNFTINEAGTCIFGNGTANFSMDTEDNLNFNSTYSVSSGNSYAVYAYCNDTTGNLNNSESVVFSVNATPQIGLEVLYPESFDNMNATQNEFFNVTLNVTCLVGNCGTVNVSLDPFLTGWSYRKPITIDQSVVDEDLTNFTVLVKLNSTNFDFTKARAEGYDIRFTSSDEQTLLEFERERHNATTNQSEYWVKVPTISATENTIIYMYYGKADATNGEEKANAWDNNTIARYSMKDLTTSSVEDSLGNSNGTKSSALAPVEADAKIAKGQSFDVSKNYITSGNSVLSSIPINNNFVISFWAYANSNVANKGAISWSGTDDLIIYPFDTNAGNGTRVYWRDVGGNLIDEDSAERAGGWHNFVFGSWGTTDQRLYVDGIQVKNSTASRANSGPFEHNLFRIGTFGTQPFIGIIDEVRMINSSRSDSWIKADYNSGQSTLLSLGAEEENLLGPIGQEGDSAKGLINTTAGATPFYTNATTNPLTTISLIEGESDTITFWVNATGTAGNNYTFFAFANMTSDLGISNITNTWNVTIISGCVQSLANTTATDWINVGSCLVSDEQNQSRNWTQYDENSCGEYSNETFFEYQLVACNYCSYSIVNSSFGDWANDGVCLIDDNQQQVRNKTEYDENYDSCYAVTELPSDLWNSGNNNTYYDYQNISCDYCVPSIVNSSWSEWNNETCIGTEMNQTRFLTEYDENTCYLITGLEDDLWNNVTHSEEQLTGPTYANSSWSDWLNIVCLETDYYNQSRNLTQYDIFACAENETFFEYQDNVEVCDYCTPVLANSSWSDWANDGICLIDDNQQQVRNLTQYDTNNCGEVENTTYYSYQNISCDYCVPSRTNTTWGDWANTDVCQITDLIPQLRNLTEYDENSCYLITGLESDISANVSYFEYQNASCNYCSYSAVNSSLSDWINLGSCLVTDEQNQSRFKTEYDENYGSCYAVTGLPSDLWNSGDNNTYYDYQLVACNYCSYETANTTKTEWSNDGICLINDTQLQNRSWVEYDSNYGSCYAVTGIESDLWSNITYSETQETACDYCTPSRTNTTYSDWSDVGCVGDNLNQSKFLTEYDENTCYLITGLEDDLSENATFWQYQQLPPVYANTTWTDWIDNEVCQITDSKEQIKNLTQYDTRGCASNSSFFDYQEVECNYCSYSVVNSSWSSWSNLTCADDSHMNQSRFLIEYDEDYDSCYAVTGLPSDLWNSGESNTYYEYQLIDADGCDSTAPLLTIISPLNQNYSYSAVEFNVSGSENLSSCLLSLDGAENITMQMLNSTYANYSESVADEGHTVRFSCNDSYNNFNFSSVVFGVDTSAPVFVGLENISVSLGSSLGEQINATDYIGVESYSVNDTETFAINSTGYLSNITELLEGVYYINISVNDSYSHLASEVIFVNVTNLPFCGDGVVEGSEVCDLTNLSGESCVSQGYVSGTLACAANCLSFVVTGCSSDDGSGNGGGNGGGGGGGGASAAPKNLEVDPESFEMELAINTHATRVISITNIGTSEQDVALTQEKLDGMVSFEETQFTLQPGEEKEVDVVFTSGNETGIYTGKIKVNNEKILVTIDIETELLLFDASIVVPDVYKSILLGETLVTQVTLIPMGKEPRLDVTLNYLIKDFEGNTQILESETILVDGQKTFRKEFFTNNLGTGDYVVGLELVYPNGVATSSSNFKIVERTPLKISLVLGTVIAASIILIVLIIIYIARFRRFDKSKKKKK